ncbi:hypothetical protein NEUTE1DRAFT_135159 [Neurospora tetrasperma FGSC 2508]|uniref:Uncharacterized protein n=1 Tax=Neurospora tetrasperma (strain FGSC 2508 / ATCC MYA-4615 / P0657) TaxID=510951 RepID=F8MBX4_NEUT8|nr:uncharacterized protein NEUTE1DRAFT_135159 [Neurospora tetrasperma FGSC 2508]EGO61183.1 hypothetical protein NEUTE1DRAFT_135159 [Neurospora tetrasperma FGSC 2508]EGZ74811.1 hypothetical protein NEUTE2DRAFT_163758 [Neurospora tetrasperma FGSC 2509]
MRVFAGHGCGNQDVGPFEPRRRTHNLEQHIRARQASEGLKAEETQERSHTSLYGNTHAENTSTFACVLATLPTPPFFPHAHPLSF